MSSNISGVNNLNNFSQQFTFVCILNDKIKIYSQKHIVKYGYCLYCS